MSYLETNGGRVHFQRLGAQGPLLVSVHGLIVDNLSSWYFSVGKGLSERARLVMYDLRGHGKSQHPVAGYRTGDFVADLEGLIEAVGGGEPAHVIANSFGGVVGLNLALKRPDLVRSLILLEAHLGDIGFAEGMAATMDLPEAEVNRLVSESFANWAGRHSDVRRNRLAETARWLLHDTTIRADLLAGPELSSAQLAELVVPLFCIYGEHSDLFDKSLLLCSLLPATKFAVLSGRSHSVLWDETQQIVELVHDWLDGFEPSSDNS